MPDFLLAVHHSPDEAMGDDGTPVEQIFADVETFNTDLRSADAWIYAGGLTPAEDALVVDANIEGDSIDVIEGTAIPGPVQLGGIWIIRAADEKAAQAWATRASAACRRSVEVRAFQSV